jgi:hypothetical protein
MSQTNLGFRPTDLYKAKPNITLIVMVLMIVIQDRRFGKKTP